MHLRRLLPPAALVATLLTPVAGAVQAVPASAATTYFVDRVAVLSSDGVLSVREGALSSRWVRIASNVRSYDLEDDRVAYVTRAGELHVQQGPLEAAAQRLSSTVKTVQLTGTRIGVLHDSGDVYVKDGPLNAAWTWQSSGVSAFQLEGSRIGVLRAGSTYVKEGALTTPWVWQSGNNTSFQLEGNRIGLLQGGNAYVKEGRLDASWVLVRTGATALQLEGNRIGVLSNRHLYVKEGALGAIWYWQAGGVDAFQLERAPFLGRSRIGVLQGGNVSMKEGSLSAEWTPQMQGVSAFQLEGDLVGVLRGGTAYAKKGSLTAAWVRQGSGLAGFALERATVPGLTTLTATLRYLDKSTATPVLRPIAAAQVEVWAFAPRALGVWGWAKASTVTTTTGGQVTAHMPYRQTGIVYALRVFATNSAVVVWPDQVGSTIPFNQEPGRPGGTATHRTVRNPREALDFSYDFRDEFSAKHYNVAETSRWARSYAMANRGDSDVLPRASFQLGGPGSYYNPANDTVNLVGDQAFEDATILHEYAHFLQEQVGDLPWQATRHNGCVATDVVSGKPVTNARWAWMEGFANYYAEVVRRTYPAAGLAAGGHTLSASTMETPRCPPSSTPGDGVEVRVAGVLWDTFDRNPGDIGLTAETGDALERHGKAVFQILDNELDDRRGGATIGRFRTAWAARGLNVAQLNEVFRINGVPVR